jgi:hypothetical protein
MLASVDSPKAEPEDVARPLPTASNPDQKTSPQTSSPPERVRGWRKGSQGARTATRRLLGTVCPTPCDKRCHSAIPDSPRLVDGPRGSCDFAHRGRRGFGADPQPGSDWTVAITERS